MEDGMGFKILQENCSYINVNDLCPLEIHNAKYTYLAK